MKKILLLLALTCQAAIGFADVLDLTTAKSDAIATTLTLRCFEGMGLEVVAKESEQFTIRFGGYNIGVLPMVLKDHGAQINAYVTFKGRNKSNATSAELQAVLNKINAKYNYTSVYVDQDGDITFRYCLLFDKLLEPKLINKWLKRVEIQTDIANSEFGDSLKPFLK
jgi:Putative bacterial sensory transduction regulator